MKTDRLELRLNKGDKKKIAVFARKADVMKKHQGRMMPNLNEYVRLSALKEI